MSHMRFAMAHFFAEFNCIVFGDYLLKVLFF
jgi:hypothetical protein